MAVSANRLELLQIADAVAREKSIDRGIVPVIRRMPLNGERNRWPNRKSALTTGPRMSG